jgi:Transposase IS4
MADPPTLDSGPAASSANEDPSSVSQEGGNTASTGSERIPRVLFARNSALASHDDPASTATDTANEPNSQSTGPLLNEASVNDDEEEREINVGAGTHDRETPSTLGSPDMVKSPQLRKLPNVMEMQGRFEAGYDSDGEGPPSAEEEDYDETALRERGGDGALLAEEEDENQPENLEEEAEDTTPRHIAIDEDALKKLIVKDIKHELFIREVQFASTLKKPELLERLRLALQNQVKVSIFGKTSSDKAKKKKGPKATITDMSGFTPGAYWEVLEHNPTAVEEPTNTIPNARAPTVPEDEAGTVPIKYNFPHSFDRPIFTGKMLVQKTHLNGRKATDTDGNPIMENVLREKITMRRDFLQKHKLTRFSDPVEFANAFIPWTHNPYDNDGFSMAYLTTMTNTKAKLANAGPGGVCYRTYKDFTVKELRQHLGLYIWNGIRPAPQMHYHMVPQASDPVHGSDYIRQHMGTCMLRHKHFRAFFACQDPRKPPPNRKTHPLNKVSPVLKWMNFIGKNSVRLGMNCSVDEQTVGFQGKHQDKLRVTYKVEGDGFQADTICERGFTYAHYFRNDPPPREYIKKGMSPLHSRVLWLFDQLADNHHRVWMDNLYLSAKFVKASYNHPRKVMIAGVTRRNGRGLPMSVIQDEVKNKTAQEAVRGTVKAAVLKGDPDCPNLVAVSVYDTKPVHFMSIICACIEWIVKERQVYNAATKKTETLRYLRLNLNDEYNNKMGHVDISDQLRNYYRFDHWARQWKWWWSIWNWALGVLLVNAYVSYQLVMEESGIPRSQLMTHYDFRREIALAWIASDEPSIKERQKKKEERKRKMEDAATPNNSERSQSEKSSNSSHPSKRRKKDDNKMTTRAAAVEEATKKERAPTLKDASLLDTQGPLGKRLNPILGHFPEQIERGARCAVHRWSADIEVKSHVYCCSVCKINLCIQCFKVFHTAHDLVEMKDYLKSKFLSEKDSKSQSTKATKK